ncbi:MAG: sulfite exporter TauE/SafE family protein [Gammaproteobacteria bacterium]|nr:sulfite exporter TauE/SafE family protein [Gammaproteobacteria bacterium]
MIPITPVSLSFGAALLLGLSFGSGPCNIACLPYLGPVFLSTNHRGRQVWRTILPFSLGRMIGYALLAGAAGGVGLLVEDWIASPWVRWLLGGATILVAISLLWRRYRGNPSCHKTSRQQVVEVRLEETVDTPALLPGGLFLMGMGMALNPCAPLTTVILAAATTASILAGMSLGIGFGLGAVFIPTLVFAFGIAHFGTQIRQHLSEWRIALENTSVGLLILMGVGTAMGWIVP